MKNSTVVIKPYKRGGCRAVDDRTTGEGVARAGRGRFDSETSDAVKGTRETKQGAPDWKEWP
jgi:hypothetical protein